MVKTSYDADYLADFGFDVDYTVNVYAEKFGMTLDEAARRMLNDEDYEAWKSSHSGDVS